MRLCANRWWIDERFIYTVFMKGIWLWIQHRVLLLPIRTAKIELVNGILYVIIVPLGALQVFFRLCCILKRNWLSPTSALLHSSALGFINFVINMRVRNDLIQLYYKCTCELSFQLIINELKCHWFGSCRKDDYNALPIVLLQWSGQCDKKMYIS